MNRIASLIDETNVSIFLCIVRRFANKPEIIFEFYNSNRSCLAAVSKLVLLD